MVTLYLFQKPASCADVDNAACIPADTPGSAQRRSRPFGLEQSPAACERSSVASFPPSPHRSYPETADLQPGRSLTEAPGYTETLPGAAEMPTFEPSPTACVLTLETNIKYQVTHWVLQTEHSHLHSSMRKNLKV